MVVFWGDHLLSCWSYRRRERGGGRGRRDALGGAGASREIVAATSPGVS